jgi:ribosome-associated translation inhibitor RaiA
MIEADLIHYLRHTEDTSDSVSKQRLDAIRTFRNYVGDRVTIGRVPRKSGVVHVQLTKVSEDRADDLGGQDTDVQTTIQVDVWTKGDSAAITAEAVAKSVYKAISSYSGRWNQTLVYSATQERAAVLTDEPDDGTRYWDYRDSRDYLVSWQDVDIAD